MSNQYRSARDANKLKNTSFFEKHEIVSFRRAGWQNGGCPERVFFRKSLRFLKFSQRKKGARDPTGRLTQTLVPDPKASREELYGVRIP